MISKGDISSAKKHFAALKGILSEYSEIQYFLALTEFMTKDLKESELSFIRAIGFNTVYKAEA